jgi:anthranilate phosphoribosyltransferase
VTGPKEGHLAAAGRADGTATDTATESDIAFDQLGGWPGVLSRLLSGSSLDASEAETVLGRVLAGQAEPTQIAALAVALRAKGESVEEMTGFVRAMVQHAVPLPLPTGIDVIDTCGTGGDRLRSINVSTIAALVVAATGAKVCKHGGRASSSAVGAADVLEALGAVADLGPAGVARCIEEIGLGFCFAPRFHPAMRYAAPVRKELGIPTVFNFLGPLANPGRARYQVVGVSDRTMADKMLGVLEANGAKRAWIVYGDDGLDELSTTGPSTVHELRSPSGSNGFNGGERVDDTPAGTPVRTIFRVDPEELGLPRVTIDDLRGGDAAYNADVIRRVVAGDISPHRDVAVLNAAASLVVVGKVADLKGGVELATSVIVDGGAAGVLEGFIRLTQEAAKQE